MTTIIIEYDTTGDLTEDVLNILSGWSTDEARLSLRRGASLSHVLDLLRDKGWRNLKDTHRLEDRLTELGFKVVPARLKNGTEHAYNRVVTL